MSLKNEKKTLRLMLSLFCRRRHHTAELCSSCADQYQYAEKRLMKCPFGDKKPTCRKCTIHCYSPEMRERVSEVMRFAGPRMIFRHPVIAVRHLLNQKKPNR